MAGYRLPPRQKMINLVYIILIAMLAINISSDTLDTYFTLDRGVTTRIEELSVYSKSMRDSIITKKPHLSGQISAIDSLTNGLLNRIDGIKEDIAKAADKKKYTSAEELKAHEELNAVPDVMLSAINPQATMLKEALTAYVDTLVSAVSDSGTKGFIRAFLDTRQDRLLSSWEKATFTSMPAIGGMVYMNTLKENILLAEIETFRSIAEHTGNAGTDQEKDKPAVTTDYRYVLINNDQKIVSKDGTIEVPVVNVTPHMENVLYAEFENPVDILAVGITPENIDYSIEGGYGYLKNGMLYICPDSPEGEVVLGMSCIRNGERRNLGTKTFRTRPLPAPVPYIKLSGDKLYSGNVPIEKSEISSPVALVARIAEPISIEYTVTGFETVLIKSGNRNVMSARSDGPHFSREQKDILRSAENGDKIYFTGITVKSPQGRTTYELPPISAPVYE